jgi:hypothetical protein
MRFNIRDQKIRDLPYDEFDKLAKDQTKKYPDLLEMFNKEEIIDMFYEFYGRERKEDDLP